MAKNHQELIKEYQQRIREIDSQIEVLNKQKYDLIKECKEKYLLCVNCLSRSRLTNIASGEKCHKCTMIYCHINA